MNQDQVSTTLEQLFQPTTTWRDFVDRVPVPANIFAKSLSGPSERRERSEWDSARRNRRCGRLA